MNAFLLSFKKKSFGKLLDAIFGFGNMVNEYRIMKTKCLNVFSYCKSPLARMAVPI